MGRLGCGALGGAFVGIVSAIKAMNEGDSLLSGVGITVIGILMGMGFMLWLGEKLDGGGGEVEASADDQIYKLQKRLRGTLETAENAAARGDHATAAHMRSQAAVIESQLRRLGA